MPRPPSTSRRVEPWALAIASVLALGCRGEDLSNDCDYQGQVYFQTVEGEVTDLLSPVPDRGPYPVALQLTEEGINRLLGGAVADQDVPFAGTLPLGFATAEFEPTSDPVIELTDLPTCRRCILFNLQFNIDLYSGDNPISSGPGNVTLSIPLRLESDEAAGESTLLADYSQAKIESMFLFVYGIDSNEHEVLAGALAVLLTEQIQEQFDTVELLKIGSWQIGEGDVTLLARELFVLPEDDKLVLGMQTNLPLPADAGLDLAGPLPEGIPMETAALLSCGVITGLGAAVNTARIRPGEVVVVIGAGGVGLNAIQGARLAGAARVIAVDTNPAKLDAARDFGATDALLATDPKPWAGAKRIAGRGADAVLVTVGAIPAYDSAARYLAPGGRLVAVGMPHSGAKSAWEPVILAATGQAITGSFMGDTVLARDIPWIVDLYHQGRLKLDELISGRWTLDQINEAIADTRTGAARRNVLIF